MKGITTMFPRQRLSTSEKLKDNASWAKSMVDYIAFQYTGNQVWDSPEERHDTGNEYHNMLANYQLYNNVLNQKDFEREFNPFGLQIGQFKDEIKPYNKTYNKIQVLLGEELKRPFDYRTVIINDDGIKSKLIERDLAIQDKVQQIVDTIYKFIQSRATNSSNPESMGEEEKTALDQKIQETIDRVMSPDEIEKNFSSSFIHRKERVASKVLRYLTTEQHILDKKNDAFKHGLISGKEFVWVGIEGGVPVVKTLNSPGVIYDINSDVKWVQYGQFAGYRSMMHSTSILDLYGDDLRQEDINLIEGKLGKGASNTAPFSRNMIYQNDDVALDYLRNFEEGTYVGQYHPVKQPTESWAVTHSEWRSQRKVYFLSLTDVFGETQMDIVSEDFAIPSYATKVKKVDEYGKSKTVYSFDGYTAEESWVTDIWTGIRIGDNIYARVGRKPYQTRSIDNPNNIPLGYHGVVYSAMNAPSVSLMDRMKPFQYLYFLIMHRLKELIAKDRGKTIHFDVTMVDPKIGIEKTLYYLDKLDIDFFNPLQNAELPGAYQRGKITGSTDRSNMQHIMNYVQLLAAIDDQISDVAGVTRQREGQSAPHETVTNHQTAIIQSSHITEIYFHTHDKLWENVLTSLVQTAQQCWKNKGIRKQYVLDDLSVETLNITPEEISDVDFGVFITNSRKDLEVMGKMERLAETALSAGAAKFTDMIKMFKSNSIAELEDNILDADKRANKQIQEQRQAEQEMMDKQLAAKKEELDAQRTHEKELKLIDRETQLMKAEIDAFKFQQDLDSNNDGIPDPLQIEQLRSKERIEEKKIVLEREKLEAQKEMKKMDIAQKKANPTKR
jgi:hypothetical protein